MRVSIAMVAVNDRTTLGAGKTVMSGVSASHAAERVAYAGLMNPVTRAGTNNCTSVEPLRSS